VSLYNKPRWLVINKIDMVEDAKKVAEDFVKKYGWQGPVFAISAINGVGCKELTYAIMDHLDEVKRIETAEVEILKEAQKKEALINAELKKAGLSNKDNNEQIATD